jgi:hypothetical protein
MRGVALLLFSGAVGCTDTFDVRLEPRTDPPVQVFLAGTIRMPIGAAVVVSAQPYKDGSRMPPETTIELVPERPAILGAARVDLEPDPDDADLEPEEQEGDWGYAFWGATAGTTDVVVYIDGEEALRLDAAVSGL